MTTDGRVEGYDLPATLADLQSNSTRVLTKEFRAMPSVIQEAGEVLEAVGKEASKYQGLKTVEILRQRLSIAKPWQEADKDDEIRNFSDIVSRDYPGGPPMPGIKNLTCRKHLLGLADTLGNSIECDFDDPKKDEGAGGRSHCDIRSIKRRRPPVPNDL